MSEESRHVRCERTAGHAGVHASMIGAEELAGHGVTENQVQEWANESERGYNPHEVHTRDPSQHVVG